MRFRERLNQIVSHGGVGHVAYPLDPRKETKNTETCLTVDLGLDQLPEFFGVLILVAGQVKLPAGPLDDHSPGRPLRGAGRTSIGMCAHSFAH